MAIYLANINRCVSLILIPKRDWVMSDKIEVTFSCKSCGADPTTLELPDDYTDDSIAKCRHCGVEYGRLSDIKAEAMKHAQAKVIGIARSAFKGLKGFKIK